MVAFGRLLEEKRVPEWAIAYIDYSLLKGLLNVKPQTLYDLFHIYTMHKIY